LLLKVFLVLALVLSNSVVINFENNFSTNNFVFNDKTLYKGELSLTKANKPTFRDCLKLNWAGSISLADGEYIFFETGTEYGRFRAFEWSFSTTPNVGISVYAMSNEVFDNLCHGHKIVFFHELTYKSYADDGKFRFPQKNSWIIIFVNDGSFQSTTLSYSCEIIRNVGPLMIALFTLLGLVIVASIVVTIAISLGVIKTKKRRTLDNQIVLSEESVMKEEYK